jgi:hypothetical protein
VYGVLPHRLRTLDQIFNRFPQHLGVVERVAVPVTVEVAYRMTVGTAPPENVHLSWVTTLGFVPTRNRSVAASGGAPVLRLDTWDVGGGGAWVTVRHDAPAGPVVVHSSPPGSGP